MSAYALAGQLQRALRDAETADSQAANHNGRPGQERDRAREEARRLRGEALDLASQLANAVVAQGLAKDTRP